MRLGTLWGAALFCFAPALAIDHSFTATKERLWWMEPHVHEAVEHHRVPLTLLPSGEPSQFRIYLMPKFRSRTAQTLYQKSTGRMDDTRLEFYDSRSESVVVSHDFHLHSNDYTRRRAAFRFVELIKRHLAAP
jgi:hypothetical protein